MPKLWLYFPFDSYKTDYVMSHAEDDMTTSGIAFDLVARSRQGCLSVIGREDILLISAHGELCSGNIYLKESGEGPTMTANDLASQIALDLLPKAHQSIVLLTCYGGGVSEWNTVPSGRSDLSATEQRLLPAGASRFYRIAQKNLQVSCNKSAECLASILGAALGKRQYFDILVGGWPGPFTSWSKKAGNNAAFVAGKNKATDPLVLAQLDHIQWYDCRGAQQ
jgi:hypothetical protein